MTINEMLNRLSAKTRKFYGDERAMELLAMPKAQLMSVYSHHYQMFNLAGQNAVSEIMRTVDAYRVTFASLRAAQ